MSDPGSIRLPDASDPAARISQGALYRLLNAMRL